MFKFRACILKEFRLLIRDKVGLALMFIMPVVLVIIMTAVQNSTYVLVNDNKISLAILNKDNDSTSTDLITAIQKSGMFNLIKVNSATTENEFNKTMHDENALAGLIIPASFSSHIKDRSEGTTIKALRSFGLHGDSATIAGNIPIDSLVIYFNPVLQESYRYSIRKTLEGLQQIIENKIMIRSLYLAINQKQMPADFENDIMQHKIEFQEKFISVNGKNMIPNATQHNVPAWTIFAMFFTVISLGGNMVKEKLSGSFMRLRILPTNYFQVLLAKQAVYLASTLIQVLVIFSLGVWFFPIIDLPALNIPSDLFGLITVSIIIGGCAISYGLCIGVWAATQEQANGFSAVSVVILAAIGGIFVPSFAVPHSFQLAMNLSPMHWGLESYYGLFLEQLNFNDMIKNVLPLIMCTMVFQLFALIGLKRKNLL